MYFPVTENYISLQTVPRVRNVPRDVSDPRNHSVILGGRLGGRHYSTVPRAESIADAFLSIIRKAEFTPETA